MKKSYQDFLNTKITVNSQIYSFTEEDGLLFIVNGNSVKIPFKICFEEYLFDAYIECAKHLIELEGI